MNDRLKELLDKALKRLDLTVTGALVVILVLSGYLYLREKNYSLPEPPPPSPKNFNVKFAVPGHEVPESNLQYGKAVKDIEEKFIAVNPDISESEQGSVLIRRNMFDLKSIEEQQEFVEEINRDYNVAETLYRERKYEEAKALVEDILKRDPNHAEAQDLKRLLEQATSEGGSEGT